MRLKTSDVNISDGNIKYPMGKSIFPVNFPLKLFRVTVSNAHIESLKSLQAFFNEYLYHTLVEF